MKATQEPGQPQRQQVKLEGPQFQQAIFDAIPEQIAVIDAEGRIVCANHAWEVRLGTSFAAIPGQESGSNYLEVCRKAVELGNEGMKELCQGVEKILKGGIASWRAECRCVHEKQGFRWFSVIMTPLADGGAVLVHEDVTKRKMLGKEIISIEDYERQQLAKVLHDGLCQALEGNGLVDQCHRFFVAESAGTRGRGIAALA